MVSRRAPSQVLNQVQRAIENNEHSNRVLIPDYWFETDAYGAAVAGILKSIELGLASDSLGQGEEEFTMVALRERLQQLDPAIKIRI